MRWVTVRLNRRTRATCSRWTSWTSWTSGSTAPAISLTLVREMADAVPEQRLRVELAGEGRDGGEVVGVDAGGRRARPGGAVEHVEVAARRQLGAEGQPGGRLV